MKYYTVTGFDRVTSALLYVTEDGTLTQQAKYALKASKEDCERIARAPDLLQRRRVDSLHVDEYPRFRLH